MPHVTISHFPKDLDDAGRERLVARLTEAVRDAFDVGEDAVSIALRPVAPEAWDEEVYRPEITARPGLLVKRPGH
ncbi:tautomerase family protein [Streptomyces sp. TG1A-8]|uniref:tautomerase family protein n=1 Tax=Streptomyces sp. TG1A-8 TaxID=3051385 RepID=UPI00265BBE15|nr:tautomerase family protein [Streptomyces sp. TG1A-8]MDO0925912.1 tautomerase family protein [Streptomyces sp. TG1A-8]